MYNGNGKTPLLCGAIAFVGLAVAMVGLHMYLLIAVTASPPLVLVTWDPDSVSAKTLTFQAAFFFVSTWLVNLLSCTINFMLKVTLKILALIGKPQNRLMSYFTVSRFFSFGCQKKKKLFVIKLKIFSFIPFCIFFFLRFH